MQEFRSWCPDELDRDTRLVQWRAGQEGAALEVLRELGDEGEPFRWLTERLPPLSIRGG